ncbi:MAG: hypothetical protein RQ745_06295, partial [Longimicrobiales bacterium]|nr:hypothetical protein [Longimicrobiales bacterium]
MTPPRTLSSTTIALLAGLLALQGVLVAGTFTPGAHSGGDNAGYVALADALTEGAGYVERWEPGAPNHTKYPPVFAGLLALLVAFGAERWVTLKLVAALAGVIAVGATFLWARRRIPEGVAALVALVFGLSYSLLYHSRYILSDVPFVAFALLALWLLEARREVGEDPAAPAPSTEAEAGGSGRSPGSPTVFALALLGVMLAWFTRSAGLPLVLALLGTLALRRAWARLAVAGGVLAVPGLAWSLRSGSTEGEYGAEFLLVDPYDPGLGRVDLPGLVERIGANAGGYLTEHLPAALAGPGAGAGWVGALILLLALLAVVGWIRALRPAPGTLPGAAELFFPLYLGVVLLWPPVWSGDRFALPLLPLLLVYAIEGGRWITR